MEKIKPNCKKSKPCSECGKCKPKKVNTTEENINIEKFKAKCEKKLRFLESFDPTVENLVNLVEPIALSLNSDIDDENLNRIIEHPKRLLYHANEILNIDNMDEFIVRNIINSKIKYFSKYYDISITAKESVINRIIELSNYKEVNALKIDEIIESIINENIFNNYEELVIDENMVNV